MKTGEKVAESIKRYNRHGAEFDVVSNPEFLREGCAVADLMNPDRIVIGAQSERAIDLMKKIYEPFMAPILVTDINSAELIKHAANSFLALNARRPSQSAFGLKKLQCASLNNSGSESGYRASPSRKYRSARDAQARASLLSWNVKTSCA